MNKESKIKVKKLNISLPVEIDIVLRELATKTGHKMSKIIEKGILLFKRENQ